MRTSITLIQGHLDIQTLLLKITPLPSQQKQFLTLPYSLLPKIRIIDKRSNTWESTISQTLEIQDEVVLHVNVPGPLPT